MNCFNYILKFILPCFLFFGNVFFHASSAQEINERYVDSVLNLTKTQNTKGKISTYDDLGTAILRKVAPDKASNLFQYVFSKDTTKLAKICMYDSYAKSESRSGRLTEAIALKKEGIALSEKLDDERRVIIYQSSLANSYLQANLPDKALYHLNIAEPLAMKDNNLDLLWIVYYNKGILETMLEDNDAAAKYYLKMWDAVKNYENTPRKRFVLYILVDFFAQVDYPKELAKYTELLAQHYEDANPNTPAGHMPIKAIFANKIAPEHIPRYKEAIKISDSLNSINSYVHTTIALTDAYRNINEQEKALPYLLRAKNKLDSLNKPSQLMDIYLRLSQTNEELSNYKDAFKYKTLESSIRDSLTSEKMQRNIAELEIEFDTEKKELQISEQKLELEKRDMKKRWTQYGIVFLGFLLGVLVLFFLYRLKSQKTIAQQTESIQNQKITELQQKNKLLAMNSMIEGQEAERLRIAKDLHDSLGGLLATVKAHFTSIQSEIEQLERLNLTGKTNDLIDEACLEVRRISHNMMPHALTISGLKGALEDVGEHLTEQGLKTNVEISNLPLKIETTKEVMIYRLVQEIVSNIRKHAEAKNVLIQLIGYKEEVNLIIEDDGVGFDHEKALEKGGLGLKSIKSRVEFLDGTINWDTKPGQGTSITINIPTI